MIWVRIGSVAMALAVMLGAFGAHGLKSRLSADLMEIYKTGVLYHLIHALGLILVGILCLSKPGRYEATGILLCVGIVLFSGSLYVLAVSGIRWMGAITPLGGVSFIAAWILLAKSS